MADTTPQPATCGPSLRTFTGWTIVFMVLLRIAIGWHFFYEGAWKLSQPDWRATSYLTASSGPLRPVFRWMIWDVDGRERMTSESITKRIDEKCALLVQHYGFNEDQEKAINNYRDLMKKAAKAIIDEARFPLQPADYNKCSKEIKAIIDEGQFQLQLADYNKFIDEIKAQERPWGGGTDYNTERLVYNYTKKNTAMNDLLTQVERPLKDLEKRALAICNAEQLSAGPIPNEKSQTYFIDWANMLALTVIGACLLLGLFTRLAALGGIGLMALYYFAMPPWPGLPQSPMSGGHFLIVNTLLIEMIALFMIASTRIGRWGGFDALIVAWMNKKSRAANDKSGN
ncbi:MAG: DoxX family protein [Planctomycetota bacterium]|jgi:uncharacterized membrane protein YphA (DoxX/SURF4 family)